jgi:peptidoglycan hydrolase CwlO-like protein
MAARMQQRRGTAAQWTSANPILGSGEIGFETDTNKFKIGNGTSTWTNLLYFANLNEILDGAPVLLNTLSEISSAIGDDPNFITTIGNALALKADISYVDDEISDLDTAAQGYADTAESTAIAYTDSLIGDETVDGTSGNTVTARIASAVSGLVDSAPSTLNTLNELAAALNDDASFATTVTTSIGTKLSKAGDTMTGDLTLAAAPTENLHAATKLYVDGSVGGLQAILEQADSDILGDISTINSSISDISTDITNLESDLSDLTTTVNNTSTDVTDLQSDLSALTTTVNNTSTDVTDLQSEFSGLANDVTDLSTDITNTQSDLSTLTSTVGDISTDVTGLESDISDLTTEVNTKAPAESPTFTGTVVLPGTTSVGTVTSSEIEHLSGVTSAIQDQIDDKLDSGVASSTYAPLNNPTFGGTVSLPSTTSIGNVSSTEIGYLDGVTSSVQTQLTDLDTTKADIESPTFTGTVSGITSSMVGLGNVDNTSDANKPVSTATQSALDAKLNLSGGTLTGKITLDGEPTQALHAATKAYVDNVSAGLHIHEAAHTATTNTLAILSGGTVTYNNGTDGVGATLTLGTALSAIDGHTLNNGDRILVKNQANAVHNGIYVRTSSTVLTRSDDFNSAAEMAGGDLVFIENGTLYNSTSWVLENEVNIVGTDDLLFAQFSGAGTVTAGTNVSVTGLQVSVVNAPTFSGLVTATSGVAFSDGTQTKVGVPSLTAFVERTASYTLDTLTLQDSIVEMNSTSPTTFTIPTNAALAWPIGASMDIFQTNTGEVTIAASPGVTLNRTPGNKLRTQWSSATILKRGSDSWVLYGDLKA